MDNDLRRKVDTCVNVYQSEYGKEPDRAIVDVMDYMKLHKRGLTQNGNILFVSEERGLEQHVFLRNSEEIPIQIVDVESLPKKVQEKIKQKMSGMRNPLILARRNWRGRIVDRDFYALAFEVPSEKLIQGYLM